MRYGSHECLTNKLTGAPPQRPAESTTRTGASALTDGLGNFVLVCTQDGIDPRLVTWTLLLEPIKDICINPQRNRGLRLDGLKALTHDSANNVFGRCLGMICTKPNVTVLGCTYQGPVRSGFA